LYLFGFRHGAFQPVFRMRCEMIAVCGPQPRTRMHNGHIWQLFGASGNLILCDKKVES
jgi:hypothetical protein